MTHTIPLNSTKRDRAIRFGKELERAMKARGVGARAVAEPLGCGRTIIMYWRSGRVLPRIDSARKLAMTLEWPRLESLALELRRKHCLVDNVEFIDETGSDNRQYCSISRQRARQKGLVGSDRRTRVAIAERRLVEHRRAVAAFCNECEPDGRCVTADCPLRPVSPLPLFASHLSVEPARAKPHNGYRAPGADSARVRRTWAGYTPEQRAERVARAAEARKAARGLVEASA